MVIFQGINYLEVKGKLKSIQVEKTFSEQELNDFFEANKKEFEVPRQIQVEYLKIVKSYCNFYEIMFLLKICFCLVKLLIRQ